MFIKNHLLTINVRQKKVVNIHEIIHAEANVNYTTLHMISGKKITIAKSIVRFEELLPTNIFKRVHRKFLVNINHTVQTTNNEVRTPHGELITKFSRRKTHSILD